MSKLDSSSSSTLNSTGKSPLNERQAMPSNLTLSEIAYQKIRQLILDNQLPPGAVVSERLLAERLELGKAPIRAAVARLASEGLVSTAARQGIVIRAPTVQDLNDLYEMRIVIERFIVGQIAGKLRREDVDRLRDNLAEYRRVTESTARAEALEVDFAFHRLLAEFHGNVQMAEALDRILDAMYREVKVANVFLDRVSQNVQEHQAVVDAIIGGEADLAEARISEHLRLGQQLVLLRGGMQSRK